MSVPKSFADLSLAGDETVVSTGSADGSGLDRRVIARPAGRGVDRPG